MMGSFITRAVIMALGYVYPAYECFKIVERKRPDLEHLRFWCQYWMIIAVVTVIERLADVLVSWVPMYSEAKLAFIIYLWYPRTMGTTYVYTTFLRPLVLKHESEIDRNLNELRTRAGDVAIVWWQKGSVYAQARFYELLQYIALQSNRNQQTSISQTGTSRAPPRPPAQGPPRGLSQGGPPLYPPPPPAGAAAKGAGFPPDSSYPPPGAGADHGKAPFPLSQAAQAGPQHYPPSASFSSGPILRRPSGSRSLSDGEGDADYDIVEKQSEKRTGIRPENRLERSGPSVGEQNLPSRVNNTRSRQRANSPWNLSVWLPTWLGTAPPEKVD